MPQTALVIEDDAILAKIFSHTLTDIDYETHIAKNGNTAMEYLEENVPGLVILDLHIPFITGDKILEKIRSEERFSAVNVIIVTADPAKAKLFEEQSELVLIKPASILTLQQMVKSL